MRIGKPLLIITTPIGVVIGVYEAFRLAGGLAFLMIALLLMISACFGMLIHTARKERAAELAQGAPGDSTPEEPASPS